MNETRVYALGAAEVAALERNLRAELPANAEWRSVDHAVFAVKALGASVVCYRSGKLVVQGNDLDAFAGRFLGGFQTAAAKTAAASAARLPFTGPTIGSDEAGKGDYFGPLVVAAVHAAPGPGADELLAMGVADSKTLTDQRMFPMAERIERSFDCEIRELVPAEYNERWRADPNVNHVLADLHADAIATLLRRHPGAGVIVDRFGDEKLIASRLQRLGAPAAKLLMVPQAEAHPVVGAASIVARVRFVEGYRRCEEEAGTELHKGAGEPVDKAAQRVFAIGGAALLRRVAKLHFKNSQRIAGFQP